MIAIYSAKSLPRQQPSSPVAPPSPTLQSHELTDGNLSAWEKWILQKAKQERDAAEEILQKQEEIEKTAELERAEVEKKKAETAAKIQVWIEQYDATVKQKRRLQQKHDKAEQELKEEQKLEVLSKAKEKFQVCSVLPSLSRANIFNMVISGSIWNSVILLLKNMSRFLFKKCNHFCFCLKNSMTKFQQGS